MRLKIESARRQLGTALALFLADQDPVSVHSLAGGGCEVIEFYAQKTGGRSFILEVLDQNADRNLSELRRIQRQYWTAFKHATRMSKQSIAERDDEELLSYFTDEQNDVVLFIGWTDYSIATGSMPIEAQVLQAWYLALHIHKLSPDVSPEPYEAIFPGIRDMSRSEQKDKLREQVEHARLNRDVMCDPKTDLRPLVLRWNPTASW